MDKSNTLDVYDYVVFLFIIITVIGIGFFFLFFGKSQKTVAEYFTGNRKLNFIPTILSFIVSHKSSISIVGVPAEAYYYGGQYLLMVICIIGSLLAAQYIVPVIYPLKVVSINQYLELRWKSKFIKSICCIFLVSYSVMYLGVVTYSASVVLSVFSNWSLTMVIITMSSIAICFTMMGGLKAVIWTDVILCLCMFSGVFMLLTSALLKVGGFGEFWRLARSGGRLDMLDFRFDPTIRYSFWAFLVGGSSVSFCSHSFHPASVQRYVNVKSLSKAKSTVLFSHIGELLFHSLCCVVGIVLYSYYASIGCDPLKQGSISTPNQLVPHFVLENLHYSGVLGFFAASNMAASISTVSSYLNASAAMLWDDLCRHIFPNVSAQRATNISRCIVLCIGLLSMMFSIMVQQLGGTVIQLWGTLNVSLIPVWGTFIAGLFCPWFNKKGLMVGTLCCLGTLLWISGGQYYTDTLSHSMLSTSTDQCYVLGNNSLIYDLDEIPDGHLTTHLYNGVLISEHNDTIYTTPVVDISSTQDGLDETQGQDGLLVWIFSISFWWYLPLGLVIFIATGIY